MTHKLNVSDAVERAKAADARIEDWAGADHFDDCLSRNHEGHDCSCPDTDEGEEACANLVESECDCYLGAMRDAQASIRALTALADLSRRLAEELHNFRGYYAADHRLAQEPERSKNAEMRRADSLLAEARAALDARARQWSDKP